MGKGGVMELLILIIEIIFKVITYLISLLYITFLFVIVIAIFISPLLIIGLIIKFLFS